MARIRVVGIPPPSGVIVRGLDPQTVLQPLQRHLAQDAVGGDILFPKLEHVVYQAFWEHELHSRLLLQPNLQVLQLPLMAYTMAVRICCYAWYGSDLNDMTSAVSMESIPPHR